MWENAEDRHRLVDGLRDSGFVKNLEARFIKKNGQPATGLISAGVLNINDEKVVLSISKDITERKQVEQALRDSEKRFRDLAEMLPEAVFETDENMMLTYANRLAFKMFGYTREDIRALSGLEFLVPEDRLRAKENLMQRLEGDDLGTVEYHALRKDGHVFPVMFRASRILTGKTCPSFLNA